MRKFTILFALLVAMVSTAMADDIKVSISTNTPNLFTINNGADNDVLYVSSTTAPTRTESNYGSFAFFAVDGVNDAYYIYSTQAKKYLSYTKAGSYSAKMDFVTLVDNRENYFRITKCTNYSTYYQIEPYNSAGNPAGIYLNYFGGVNSTYYEIDNGTLGLWTTDGNGDGGSRFCFTAKPSPYVPYVTGERGGSYPTRYITNIALKSNNNLKGNIAIDDTEKKQYFVDKTEQKIQVHPGDVINIELTTNGEWMQSYIYIDYDNDDFTAGLETDNYTPTGDLVSHSGVKTTTAENSFKDSKGNSAGKATEGDGNNLTEIPEFSAPTTQGEYRMRYKMDWNSVKPEGDSGFQSNSGFIVDFILEVLDPVSSRTITVKTDAAGCVVKANENIGGTTADGRITLTAEAAWGYEFVEWTLNGEQVSTEATYVDAEEGDKEYVAVFRKFTEEEQYATIAKPTFTQNGNITNITSATISAGNGIANYSSNIIPADLIPSNTNNNTARQQAGRTEFIPVAKGATFNLNIEYNTAWNDLTLVKFVQGNTEKLCGPFDGEWPDYEGDEMLESVKAAGFTRNGNIITFPITIDEDLEYGDIFVVRSIIANEDVMSTSSYNEGSYVDFCFVVGGYDLNVSSVGYSTMYLGANAIIPEGVEAYIATGCSSTHLMLEMVTGNILPKETGVIVKANQGTYSFNYTIEEAEAVTSLLTGTTANEYIQGDAYVLSIVNGELGLYKATLNKNATGGDDNTHFLNNANKAYLPATAIGATAQQSAGFRFSFGGTTAIEEITDERAQSTEIYDLQGRRVKEITAPGIYIVNGKKVLYR